MRCHLGIGELHLPKQLSKSLSYKSAQVGKLDGSSEEEEAVRKITKTR